jgi:ABC-type transporter Mla subunit MlaD
MADDRVVYSTLIALSEACKQQGAALVQTMQEVATLRDSVKNLDPTFSDVHKQNREARSKEVAEQLPQIAVLTQSLDDIILELKCLRGVLPE